MTPEGRRLFIEAMKKSAYDDMRLVNWRMCPWELPRCCRDDKDWLAAHGTITIKTGDLLWDCPSWKLPNGSKFPWKPAMFDFRRRWSNRQVLLAAPEAPDFGTTQADDYWACGSRLIWRVIGPIEFLRELGPVEDAPSPYSDALPFSNRPSERVTSMHLCQHEIVGY